MARPRQRPLQPAIGDQAARQAVSVLRDDVERLKPKQATNLDAMFFSRKKQLLAKLSKAIDSLSGEQQTPWRLFLQLQDMEKKNG